MDNKHLSPHASYSASSLSYEMFLVASSFVAMLGSVALLVLFYYTNDWFDLGWVRIESDYGLSMVDSFGLVIIAPVIETMLLALLLKKLVKMGLPHWQACTVSAMIWGLVHGVIEPARFVGTVWNFFVFSHGYLWWLEASQEKAFIAALIPHVAINAVAVMALSII